VAAPDQRVIHRGIESLQRLVELFQRRREQMARSVGLTDHQWGVLEEISTEHFMPSMFARRRDSSQAAVSKTLRQLSDKGLVDCSVETDDGRRRSYQLTSKGRRVMSQLRARREEAIDRVWSRIEPESLEAFIHFSERLSSGMGELLAKENSGREE
jgi:DNA-binding MarR family transcriptional regulator